MDDRPQIVLTADERKALQRWARRHSSSEALAMRCRTRVGVRGSDRSRTDIAVEVGCNPVTVTKWRARFARDRLDGLMDARRPGAQRSIADDVIEAVITDTLECTPGQNTRWSTRAMAARHGISLSTVAEIWRAFGLKPWKQDSFEVSPDPLLVEKIRDM